MDVGRAEVRLPALVLKAKRRLSCRRANTFAGGHSTLSRRVARLLPFYEYDDELVLR